MLPPRPLLLACKSAEEIEEHGNNTEQCHVINIDQILEVLDIDFLVCLGCMFIIISTTYKKHGPPQYWKNPLEQPSETRLEIACKRCQSPIEGEQTGQCQMEPKQWWISTAKNPHFQSTSSSTSSFDRSITLAQGLKWYSFI